MEIILGKVSSMAEIQSFNWCRGSLQCIFLSDLVTTDGRYLESFVFNPGPPKQRSNYYFPRECPTKKDWDIWLKCPLDNGHIQLTENGYGMVHLLG